jgi:hypothetical protein
MGVVIYLMLENRLKNEEFVLARRLRLVKKEIDGNRKEN